MDLLTLFDTYLRQQKAVPSNTTIKNYKSDIRTFIAWYEKEFSIAFTALSVTPQIIEIYRKRSAPQSSGEVGSSLSPRSMERHISSLRKFFLFLVEKEHIVQNPFSQIQDARFKAQGSLDTWKLKGFKDYLYAVDASPLTIKYYINDIQQFTVWAERVTDLDKHHSGSPRGIFDLSRIDSGVVVATPPQNDNALYAITQPVIEEYKHRLIQTGFSPRTVNRKLSSLRKYFVWLQDTGILTNSLVIEDIKLPELVSETRQAQYNSFPPLRLLQKIQTGSAVVFDSIITAPISSIIDFSNHVLWLEQGKPVFRNFGKRFVPAWKVGSLPKALYAPLSISMQSLSWQKKTIHYVKNYRPLWYKKYHSYAITHYVHLAILILFTSTTGLLLYNTFMPASKNQAVLGQSVDAKTTRTLSFSGNLSDSSHTPITKSTQVRFALYPDQTTPSPMWEENQTITPSSTGDFTAILGNNDSLPSMLFSQNPALYMGITIADGSELLPRKQIQTTSYADTARTLQGLPVITETNTSQNAILALDSSGNLTLEKSSPSTFQVTNGTFTLLGKSLVLTTAPGSNGDVQISPDGTGQIDIQSPIHNTSNNSSTGGVPGAVEIADLLSVVATSSSQSAFTINQNDVGPIISANSLGTAKFTVDNNGSAYIAGNVGIGWQNAIAKLQVAGTIAPANNNTYNIGSPALRWNTLYVNNIVASSSGTLGYWQRNSNGIGPNTVTDAVYIGGKDKDSSKVYLSASNDPSFVRGNFAIGTSSTNARLQVQGSGTTTGTTLVISDSNGTQHVAVMDNGNVGIGTSSPNYKLEVAGNIYAYNTSLQAADLAENYVSSQILEPGDVVIPEGASSHSGTPRGIFDFSRIDSGGADASQNDKNNNAVVKSETPYQQQVLGIISTQPGVTLNSHAATDSAHPNLYPLALSGRVPVKVTNENGDIAVGDLLTSSSIPGYAMRATKSGSVIGKALDSFSCEEIATSLTTPVKQAGSFANVQSAPRNDNIVCQGKILVFASLSMHDPVKHIYIAQNTTDTQLNTIFNTIHLQINAKDIVNTLNTTGQHAITVIAEDLVSAQTIVANSIDATNATFKTLTTQTLVSPLAQIDEVQTNVLSALTPNTDLVIKLASSSGQTGGKLVVKNASGSAVATIDSIGNASFSGTLESKALAVQTDASVSGTLRAKKIIADQIDLPANAMRDALQAGGISQNVTNVTNIYQASSSGELASPSASFASLDALPGLGKFEQGLIALGPTSLIDTTISGNLSIGRNMVIHDNSLNVYGADFEIQPFRQGGVSFLSGLMRIDQDGNLSVFGNATFAQNVDVKGTLSVGDIIASGTATLKKLNFGSVPQAIAISDTEVQASGAAGVATISANRNSLTIDNPMVTDKSLIYITPRTQTNNQTLFLQRMEDGVSFTVGIENKPSADVPFNWLIVN